MLSMISRASIALIVTLASSCTSMSQRASTPRAPAIAQLTLDDLPDSSPKAKDLSPDELQLVSDDVDALIAYCKPILSGMENDSKRKAEHAYLLSMAGLLAGAVVAPALTAANAQANAAWIAGLAGFAGATNTASEALRLSGLSGSTDATTRNDIIKNLREKLQTMQDPESSVGQIRTAIVAARAECVLYDIAVPSVPEQAASTGK